MTVVYYEGDRIYFRPIEVEDGPTLQRWVNDPRIWSTLGHRLPINGVREKEWIEKLGQDEKHINLGIVVRDGDRLIGSAGLHDICQINRSAEFGLMIGDTEAHGQGYGTETAKLVLRYGFEELNLHRIWLGVYSHNTRAIRAYEKAGYVYEGTLRQAHWKHGAYRDVLFYSVLRDEWIANQENASIVNEEAQEV